jgi:hypothetical protein
MRTGILFVAAVSSILFSFSLTAAQASSAQERSIELQRRRSEGDLERRMRNMRAQEASLREATRKPPSVPVEPKLSTEARERILRLRRVSSADTERYTPFLKQDRSGIFKLFPDLGCISKNVISVARECERFVPMSSSFTFRTNGYSDEMYHDIHFETDRLESKSFFSQGIFAVIGDEPIEAVSLSHAGVKFLTNFQTAVDSRTAMQQAGRIRSGVEADGYRYTDSVAPRENVTYAMRLIAYRLENSLLPITEETTMTEMMFHSLAFDKRLDVIVAFRILGRDENGGLTIVWKELSRQEAGKIKFGKGQPLRDFRSDLQ